MEKSVSDLLPSELADYLIERSLVSPSEAEELKKRDIDGPLFLELSREDIAIIFPKEGQFITGVKIYRHIQECRQKGATFDFSPNLSDSASESVSTITPASSSRNTDSGSRPRKRSVPSFDEFSLPDFSPDIVQAIKNDAFITAAKRNKLIRESCKALKGHCKRAGKPVTAAVKRSLGLRLYNLAPKSLGDPSTIGVEGIPEASLIKQIIKWFHNNDHQDRVFAGKVQKRTNSNSDSRPSGSSVIVLSDEDPTIEAEHLKELVKELEKPKRNWDTDKLTRLLSLTYTVRGKDTEEPHSSVRIDHIMEKFPCFQYGVYIIQELFHLCGTKFTELTEIMDKVSAVQRKWAESLLPCLQELFIEQKLIDDTNDEIPLAELEILCIKTLLRKLKPKGSKLTLDERLARMICKAEDIKSGSQVNKGIKDPYVLFVGDVNSCTDCALVCNGNIIIRMHRGYQILNMLLVLIGFCHLFGLEYNQEVRESLEFLQEKLLGIIEKKKHSTAYANLFRSVSCLQEQRGVSQATQQEHDGDNESTPFEDLETQLTFGLW